jgi:hypothetical protein
MQGGAGADRPRPDDRTHRVPGYRGSVPGRAGPRDGRSQCQTWPNSIIRGSDGNKKMYGPHDELPAVYREHFRVEVYCERVA